MQFVLPLYRQQSPNPKRRVSRVCSVLPVVLVLLLTIVGCPRQPDQSTPQSLPYQGQSIRVAVPRGWGFKEVWDLQFEDWSARTGARAELIETEMQDDAGPLWKSDNPPQLIIFPWTRRGELLAGKQLQALPADSLNQTQLDWNDLFQGLREKQGQAESGPTLVPIGSPVLVCYYRADLLEKAGLQPPETWADYQTLLDQLQTWAPGLKAAEPWSQQFRATMFLARALPYVKHSGHYSIFFDIEDGTPFINTPGFQRALEATQTALRKLPREVFQYDPVTCRNLVMTGEAALAIGLETGPAMAPLNLGATLPQLADKSKTVKRAGSIAIGFCRLPGTSEVYNPTLDDWVAADTGTSNQVTLTGFAGLCAGIPSGTSAAQSAAALNLLSSVLLNSDAAFPASSRSLCRESQTPDAATWVGKDLSASEAGKYVAVTAKSLRDRQQVSELPVLGHVQFRAALTGGLTEVLEHGKPPAEGLADIATKWQEILKKVGVEQVLASYRSALGLTKLEEL